MHAFNLACLPPPLQNLGGMQRYLRAGTHADDGTAQAAAAVIADSEARSRSLQAAGIWYDDFAAIRAEEAAAHAAAVAGHRIAIPSAAALSAAQQEQHRRQQLLAHIHQDRRRAQQATTLLVGSPFTIDLGAVNTGSQFAPYTIEDVHHRAQILRQMQNQQISAVYAAQVRRQQHAGSRGGMSPSLGTSVSMVDRRQGSGSGLPGRSGRAGDAGERGGAGLGRGRRGSGGPSGPGDVVDVISLTSSSDEGEDEENEENKFEEGRKRTRAAEGKVSREKVREEKIRGAENKGKQESRRETKDQTCQEPANKRLKSDTSEVPKETQVAEPVAIGNLTSPGSTTKTVIAESNLDNRNGGKEPKSLERRAVEDSVVNVKKTDHDAKSIVQNKVEAKVQTERKVPPTSPILPVQPSETSRELSPVGIGAQAQQKIQKVAPQQVGGKKTTPHTSPIPARDLVPKKISIDVSPSADQPKEIADKSTIPLSLGRSEASFLAPESKVPLRPLTPNHAQRMIVEKNIQHEKVLGSSVVPPPAPVTKEITEKDNYAVTRPATCMPKPASFQRGEADILVTAKAAPQMGGKSDGPETSIDVVQIAGPFVQGILTGQFSSCKMYFEKLVFYMLCLAHN